MHASRSTGYQAAPPVEQALMDLGWRTSGQPSELYCTWTKRGKGSVTLHSSGHVKVEYCYDINELLPVMDILGIRPIDHRLAPVELLRRAAETAAQNNLWCRDRAEEASRYDLRDAERRWLELAADQQELAAALTNLVGAS